MFFRSYILIDIVFQFIQSSVKNGISFFFLALRVLHNFTLYDSPEYNMKEIQTPCKTQ